MSPWRNDFENSYTIHFKHIIFFQYNGQCHFFVGSRQQIISYKTSLRLELSVGPGSSKFSAFPSENILYSFSYSCLIFKAHIVLEQSFLTISEIWSIRKIYTMSGLKRALKNEWSKLVQSWINRTLEIWLKCVDWCTIVMDPWLNICCNKTHVSE